MLLDSTPTIKEHIITTLSTGAMDSVILQERISRENSITKQGFYKALRELVASEVVVKNKQLVLLNNVWVNKLNDFLGTIDTNYQRNAENTFLGLEEGESLVYHFKTIPSLDALWMHNFFLVAKKESEEPIIFYNSHEFWSLFRFAEESFMYKWIKDNKRENYLVMGSNTDMDRSTTQYIKDMGLNVAYEETPSFNKNYFTTVIGDYILDTILDMNTANAIDKLYKSNAVWNEGVAKELEGILCRLKRSKVVISKNKKKAEQIKKKLTKYFIFT